jgi:hypothetical protein
MAYGEIWRRQRRDGERSRAGLDGDRIAAAALRIADAEGLAAVSMRRGGGRRRARTQ